MENIQTTQHRQADKSAFAASLAAINSAKRVETADISIETLGRVGSFDALVANGYTPISCRGKNPAHNGGGWQKLSIGARRWNAFRGDALGVQCGAGAEGVGYLLGLDCDVADETISGTLSWELVGPDWLVRVGRAPKWLAPLRTARPFATRNLKYLNAAGESHQVQLLGAGMQFVALGVHEKTGRHYRWGGRDLRDVALADLPLVEPEEIASRIDQVMKRFGFERRAARERGVVEPLETTTMIDVPGVGRFDLATLPPDKLEEVRQGGAAEFERALKELDRPGGTGRGNDSYLTGLRMDKVFKLGLLDRQEACNRVFAVTDDWNAAYRSFPNGVRDGRGETGWLMKIVRGEALRMKARENGHVATGFDVPAPSAVEAPSLPDDVKKSLIAALHAQAAQLGEGKARGGRPNAEQREFANVAAGLADVGALTGREAAEIVAAARAGNVPAPAPQADVEGAAATFAALREGRDAFDALRIGAKARRAAASAGMAEPIATRNRARGMKFDGTQAAAASYAALKLCAGKDPAAELVYSESAFWRRNGNTWRRIGEPEIIRAVNEVHGLPYETASGTRRFDATHDKSVAIEKIMARDAKVDDFFRPVPGLALGDCFASVDRHGVHFKPYEEAGARVRFALGVMRAEVEAADVERSKFKRVIESAMAPYGDRAPAAVRSLQELIGVGVLGLMAKVKLPKLLYFHGAAGSGKSTLISIVRAMFPPEAAATFEPTKLDQTFECARYAGKRLLMNTDVPVSSAALAGEELNNFITGEMISAQEKNKPKFDFVPDALIMLASNELPHFRSGRMNEGLKRRLAPFEFKIAVADADKRAGLAQELAEVETAVFVQWALEGAARVMAAGGEWSAEGTEFIGKEVSTWAGELDVMTAFVEERIADGGKSDPLLTSTAYAEFKRFVETNGYASNVPNAKWFGRRFEQALSSAGKMFWRPCDNNVRGFLGVSLK